MKNKLLQYGTYVVVLVAIIFVPLFSQSLTSQLGESYLFENEGSEMSNDLGDYDLNFQPTEDSIGRSNETLERTEDTTTDQNNRLVEKDGSIGIEVSDVRKLHSKVMDLVNEYDGYIISSNLFTNEGSYSRIVLRVPSDKFEMVVEKLRGIGGKVVTENIKTVDRQNRLNELMISEKNNLSEIERLQGLLVSENDQTQKNLLQNQIDALTKQVEANKKKIQDLKDQVSFSTLEVQINQSKNESIFGDDWKDLGSYISTIAIFWIKFAILLSVPMLILLGVIALRRKYLRGVKFKA